MVKRSLTEKGTRLQGLKAKHPKWDGAVPSRGTTCAKAPQKESEEQYGGDYKPKLSENLVSYCRHGQLDSAEPLLWVKWSLCRVLSQKGVASPLPANSFWLLCEHQPKGGREETTRLSSRDKSTYLTGPSADIMWGKRLGKGGH